MNVLLTILSILGFVLVGAWSYISYKKDKAIYSMQRKIDEFELYLIEHRNIKDQNVFKLLNSLKKVAKNPDMLDIQVLVMSKTISESKGQLKKDTTWFDLAIKELNPELLEIYESFNNEADKIIKMSFLKPDFVLFATPLLFRFFVKYGFDTISNIMKEYNFMLKNDEAILLSGLKMSYAT